MLKLGSVTKDKVLFLVLVFVFNLDLFKFSAAILEKGLLGDIRTVCLKTRLLNHSCHKHILFRMYWCQYLSYWYWSYKIFDSHASDEYGWRHPSLRHMCTIRSTIHSEHSKVFPDYYKQSLGDKYELIGEQISAYELQWPVWEKKTTALLHVSNAMLWGFMQCVTQWQSLFSKFSAPNIAFLAFWLAKKLRLWANIRSFTSYGK